MINLKYAYVDRLVKLHGNGRAKLLTGIRECGKSEILNLVNCRLVDEYDYANRIYLSFKRIYVEDSASNDLIEQFIKTGRFANSEKFCLFLDEIQNIRALDFVLNGLAELDNVEIYATASNMLPLKPYMSLFDIVDIVPLSFSDFYYATGEGDLKEQYNEYILQSTLPKLINVSDQETILECLQLEIMYTDYMHRRIEYKLNELELVGNFLYEKKGRLMRNDQMIDGLVSTKLTDRHRMTAKKLSSYLDFYLDNFLLYRIRGFRINVGMLTASFKYYAVDFKLMDIFGERPGIAKYMLENVVMLELMRRGYKLSALIVESYPCGFIAYRNAILGADTILVTSDITFDTFSLDLLLNVQYEKIPKFYLTFDDVGPIKFPHNITFMNAYKWLLRIN